MTHPIRTLAIGALATLWVFTFAKAYATDVPAQFHGHWCVDVPAPDSYTNTYHRRKGKHCPIEDSDDDNSVKVSARGFDWPTFSCKTFTRLAKQGAHWMVFNCIAEDIHAAKPTEWTDEHIVSISRGRLIIENVVLKDAK